MYALVRHFQRLLRVGMCTATATASPEALMGALCYDSEGCCDEGASNTEREEGESEAAAAMASTAVSPGAAVAHS
jgi:hypothetical protein